MLRSIGKQSGESVESVLRKKLLYFCCRLVDVSYFLHIWMLRVCCIAVFKVENLM